MDIGLLWVFFATIHAGIADIRQNMIRKYFTDRVAQKSALDDFVLLAIQYGIAGTAVLAVHMIFYRTPWFPGTIPLKFWLVMIAFILFNAFAAKLGLKVLKDSEPFMALLMVCLTSGLMVLADGIWFGIWPKPLGWLGIGMINIPFLFSKIRERKPEKESGKKSTWSWKLFGTSLLSLTIYNFITPATNKGCVLMTCATFTSWTAHIGIAIALLIAALIRGKLRMPKLKQEDDEKVSLMEAFLWISLPMALTNGLASYSFQLGAVIPAVYMLKRIIPASLRYWRKEGKLDAFHAFSIIMAITGAILLAVQ